MTAQPWARHFQQGWAEHAGAPELPDWLRVACLAYGSHRANGHANFKPGQVALVLARVDPQTGEVKAPARQNVQRAIQTAIRHGFLREGSTSRCLVVPAHKITGGLGNANEPCPQHSPPGARKTSQRPDLRVA